MQTVDRLSGGADGGIESERALGTAHVVVDRLGHAYDGEALFPKLIRDLQASVSPDRDERVETAGLKGGNQVIGAVDLALLTLGISGDVPKGIAAVGGAENGTAEVSDAP